tara:strand:- start:15 stop:413 length:399 start_codon:yes stop_codon:yes gene_type:complete
MGDEFFATIKIVTGEELVSKVCYIEDEDKLLLENPLQVDAARTKRGQIEISGFSFKEWIFATFDNMFIINRDHVVTITEVEGPIVDFYNATLQRMQNAKSLQGNGKKLSRGSGYLGSVKDMKKSLEDIFNKS